MCIYYICMHSISIVYVYIYVNTYLKFLGKFSSLLLLCDSDIKIVYF